MNVNDIEDVLLQQIKPVFQSNPHPSLNLSTGRKLARPAGGPLASQDYYEGQTWKQHPEVHAKLQWCVENVKSDDYENIWHLIIPPVMTLLDDYEAQYKLRGIAMVAIMLKTVPKDLLSRTGVDGLLLSSLRTCLHHLNREETPDIIRAAVPALLLLIQLTTSPDSGQRFDQLCALLGDGIIGEIWVFCSNEVDTLTASVDVLPPVLTALGVGCSRYLKALIPQLTFPLHPRPVKPYPVDFQLVSIQALGTVIEMCAPRMHCWKGIILERICKCWVSIRDNGTQDTGSLQLQRALQDVSSRLGNACPTIQENELRRVRELDSDMFGDPL